MVRCYATSRLWCGEPVLHIYMVRCYVTSRLWCGEPVLYICGELLCNFEDVVW